MLCHYVIYCRLDNRLCMITCVDVLHQINNTTAVSILVVIPVTNIGTNELRPHYVTLPLASILLVLYDSHYTT